MVFGVGGDQGGRGRRGGGGGGRPAGRASRPTKTKASCVLLRYNINEVFNVVI